MYYLRQNLASIAGAIAEPAEYGINRRVGKRTRIPRLRDKLNHGLSQSFGSAQV